MGDSQSILKEMREFVKDLGAPQPTERVLMTILAIDVLRTDSDIEGVDTFVVSEVERFRGSVISRDKKRMVIGFDGPSRAIHCTRSLIDAADEQGIQLRAAIHTGECDVISGVVSGTAIQIAESILDTSSKQNIMVTSTVKDLVAGSGFRFSACGSCKIDSIPGEWELFAMVGQR
jgi:class 3 adenylate cyclase